jgi:hypothetical protein
VKADEEFAIDKVRQNSPCLPIGDNLHLILAGKACEAGTAIYRCAIREEAQGSRDGTKDVRFSPL